MKGDLRKDQYIFFIISRSFVLRMKNVSDKSCRENQNTHFVFSNFFSPENHAVYKITWTNIVERGRPQMTIWRMRIACWITKTTDTHWGYVIIIAFLLQQWLHERPLLRYTYIACHVNSISANLEVLSAKWLRTDIFWYLTRRHIPE